MVQILKVLTPGDWGASPSNPRGFLSPLILLQLLELPKCLVSCLLIQNQISKHSWLFYFKIRAKFQFAYWFSDWWDHDGHIQEILPSSALECFETYQQKIFLPKRLQKFPILLNFYS